MPALQPMGRRQGGQARPEHNQEQASWRSGRSDSTNGARTIATGQVGTVKWFSTEKGYGFIGRDDGGADVFVHMGAVELSGYTTLRKERRVRFDIVSDTRGRVGAENIKYLR